ncbi:hypothetical protein EJB05_13471, partial [Eragrostis curvula]
MESLVSEHPDAEEFVNVDASIVDEIRKQRDEGVEEDESSDDEDETNYYGFSTRAELTISLLLGSDCTSKCLWPSAARSRIVKPAISSCSSPIVGLGEGLSTAAAPPAGPRRRRGVSTAAAPPASPRRRRGVSTAAAPPASPRRRRGVSTAAASPAAAAPSSGGLSTAGLVGGGDLAAQSK